MTLCDATATYPRSTHSTLQEHAMQVTHVRLLVRDYRACLRFWRDVVHLRLTFGDESGTYASFDTGTAKLSIFAAAEMARVVPVGPTTLASGDPFVVQLDVENVDRAARDLEARGVSVTEPTDQPAWGIRAAHFRDPEGNLFELAARLPDLPGVKCHCRTLTDRSAVTLAGPGVE